MLGSLEAQLLLGLTFFTFKTKDNLTCGLGLLVEDGLGLSSETHLLRVVTSLSLREVGGLSGLVLGDLVKGVLLALTRTVSLAFLGYVHHDAQMYNLEMNSKSMPREGKNKKLDEQCVRHSCLESLIQLHEGNFRAQDNRPPHRNHQIPRGNLRLRIPQTHGLDYRLNLSSTTVITMNNDRKSCPSIDPLLGHSQFKYFTV